MRSPKSIGTLSEGSLHRDLKRHYAALGGLTEQQVGKYVVDVLHEEHIYEIQTAHLAKLEQKLNALAKSHTVTVVYPIVISKVLIKREDGQISRRKSPRKGSSLDLFHELVHAPNLLANVAVDLELAHVEIEEVRERDLRRAWRRRHWVVKERKLLSLNRQERIANMRELFEHYAPELPSRITSLTVSQQLAVPRSLGQKFVYCFRQAGIIEQCGKDGNTKVYRLATDV